MRLPVSYLNATENDNLGSIDHNEEDLDLKS